MTTTHTGKFVSYLRVSTAQQGRSGLGEEAQRKAVADYLNGGQWKLVAEFREVESGKRDDRPQLAAALAACRLHGARLVIAKLDRLSRNAAFLLNLRDAGVKFVAADMPDANEMTIGIMAVVAEAERKMISVRTKGALAAYKARCAAGATLRPLGNPGNLSNRKLGTDRANVEKTRKANARAVDLASSIQEAKDSGATSLRAIADKLNARGIPTSRGGSWSAVQVSRVLARLGS
ncbi:MULTISPECIES: recombinase family protein [Roseomonadaceae]|uniref:Recombinase family protein n=1 Tax=Falsiroseomonas oleicola TaxID=2801474 RepID=A0ABS6H4U4_9PROT|nr:recombinase family protein [Roseomonas oleicola]MBU8543411.1 recombinase family protein [Roseomonas oleicola]